MSRQCRSKVELIQLGSAHEKYGVWTRPNNVVPSSQPIRKSHFIVTYISCRRFPVPVASFLCFHRFIFTVWAIFNGWKISRQYRIQEKPDPIYTFSCVVSRLLLFAMSSEWLIGCMVNWKTFFSILAGAPDLGKSKFEENISGTQKNLSIVRRISYSSLSQA